MRCLVAIPLTAVLLAAQPAPSLTVPQAKALAIKVGVVQRQFIDVHNEFFSLVKNLTTFVKFPSLVERLDAIGKEFRGLDLDVKRAEASKDPKISGFGKAVGQHATVLRETTEKLRGIASELSKKAKDANYYEFERYKKDVTEYEASRARIDKTGDELGAAAKFLFQ